MQLLGHLREYAGCEDSPLSPAEGDVRLVPLNGTQYPTAVCDDVHFGGVELFREGQWGRICAGTAGGDEAEFTLDAAVICRQLGFPFGTLMSSSDYTDEYLYDVFETPETPITVWANEVWLFLLAEHSRTSSRSSRLSAQSDVKLNQCGLLVEPN